MGIGAGSAVVVYTALLFYAQVVLTELSLGVAGLLYAGHLLALNLLISTIVIILTWLRHRDIARRVGPDLKYAIGALREIMCWENAALIVLALMVSIWMAAAGYLLPPRGIDDLHYHLPTIYESIVQHKLVLLRIGESTTESYPFNAELLFMWAAIFQHSQRWVDIVQFFAALYAVAVIYALGRVLELERRTAFFSSVLFLFVPVVLAQSGCNYIDLITNACYLAALFAALKYARDGDIRHLCLAGVAIGLMSGMKYNMLILALGLQVFIVLRPKGVGLSVRNVSVYLLLITVFSAYWYVRNFIVFGSPVYPVDLFSKHLGIYAEIPMGSVGFFREAALKARHLFADDIGLGTLHGGYGILYWGAGLPSWIYCLLRSFKDGQWSVTYFWLQGVTGLVVLFIAPYDNFNLVPRYSMFVAALGFLAFGKVLAVFEGDTFRLSVLKAGAVGLSLLAIVALSRSACPIFDVEEAAADYIKGDTRTPYEYLSKARWDLPSLSTAWDALDYLTNDNMHGLNCYVAMYRAVLWLSPVYGTNLQNRVWNLMEDPQATPDAFIYHFSPNEKTIYIKRKIPFEEIASTPDYMLINQTYRTALFIRRDFFTPENKKNLLASYYKKAYPASVAIAEWILPRLEPGIPIVAIPYFASGLIYMQLTGALQSAVHSVALGFEDGYARHTNWPVAYSFINPLAGYEQQKAFEVATPEGPVAVYKNTKEP
ncbi:MAG: glycosyltransferase family 39 protein [Nitrospirae bacterium]|nr:glycosyltransferase family 39 protein [Nitrospirota bacterium]